MLRHQPQTCAGITPSLASVSEHVGMSFDLRRVLTASQIEMVGESAAISTPLKRQAMRKTNVIVLDIDKYTAIPRLALV
jgi:hypothetical protein